MRPLDSRRLRFFVAVAETLHFGQAAERLGMTQPPLTAQIKRLEEELETQLFVRTSRRVTLTPAGAVLLDEAKRILSDLERAAEITRLTGMGQAGRLRIGFVSTADYSLLPVLLRRFRETYPRIELILLEMTTDTQIEAFARGELDIGLLVPTSPLGNLKSASLLNEDLVLAIPESHPLAEEADAIDVARLEALPFVFFKRESAPGYFDLVMAFARASGLRLRIVQTAVQMQTIISLVSAGLGLAIVPACMRNLRRTGVVYRAITPTPPPFQTAIAWRDDTLPAVGQFVDMAKATAVAWKG
ncbi:MAG: LysR family transcriptional regulator [Pseudomonadota bacterium]